MCDPVFKFQKKRCTRETTGTVVRKKHNGHVWFLYAEYTVDGHTYTLHEQLRYKKVKTYKIWKIPIGMQSIAPLGGLVAGDLVRIRYNPRKPHKAYMPGNEGLLLR